MNRINLGLECPYCHRDTEVIDSREIYGQNYGLLYICRGCQAWVGAHRDTGISLGRLANAELREWKIRAHNVFDRLWRPPPGRQKVFSRKQAYYWMATILQINPSNAHIGMLTVEQCKILVDACNDLDPPQKIIINF